MNLTEAEIEAIAEKIAEPIARLEMKLDEALEALEDLRRPSEARTPHPILTTAEAMEFTRCKSRATFARWLARYAPFAGTETNGRYSRAKLTIGRARELGGVKAPRFEVAAV